LNVTWDQIPLGEYTDRFIAERLGVPQSVVTYQRQKRGISPSYTGGRAPYRGGKPKLDWAKITPLLGKVPDNQLAKRFGCSRERIRQERALLGIPMAPLSMREIGRKPQYEWYRVQHLLGKEVDTVIAQILGCSASTVYSHRKQKGIPPCTRPERYDWATYDCLLGTTSDARVAQKVGCATRTVTARRSRLGIAPYRKWHFSRFDWAKYDHLLGTMSDAKVAAIVGCSGARVRDRRVEKRISAWQTHRPSARQRGV